MREHRMAEIEFTFNGNHTVRLFHTVGDDDKLGEVINEWIFDNLARYARQAKGFDGFGDRKAMCDSLVDYINTETGHKAWTVEGYIGAYTESFDISPLEEIINKG